VEPNRQKFSPSCDNDILLKSLYLLLGLVSRLIVLRSLTWDQGNLACQLGELKHESPGLVAKALDSPKSAIFACMFCLMKANLSLLLRPIYTLSSIDCNVQSS